VSSPYSKDNVRQGFLHYLLGRGLSGLAGFATVILMARYMDVTSYAGFTALSGLISFAGILAGLGLDRTLSRYLPEVRLERSVDELERFIWQLTAVKLAASLLVCIVIFAFWKPILSIFTDVKLTYFPIALACFIVAETLFQHFSSVFQSLIQQKALTRILVIQWAGRLVMIFIMLRNGHHIGLEEALWIMALPEMLGLIAFVIIHKKYLKVLKGQSRHDEALHETSAAWPNWPEIAKMSANNYGFILLAAPPQGYFMKMLAAIFLPTQLVAAYGFFINIAEKVRQYIPLHFMYNLIEPVMVGNYLENKDFSALTKRCQWLYKSNLLLLIPAIAWVAAAGTYIVAALTAGKYQDELWILLVVMVQLTIGSHIVLLQLILNSVGKSILLVRAGFYSLMGMLVYWVIAHYIHVYLLLLGPLVFSLICNTYIIHSLKSAGYAYSISLRLFSGIGLAGLVAFLVVFATTTQLPSMIQSEFLISLVSGGMIVLVYLLSLYLLKVIHQDELSFIKSLFTKRLS
jgi:O-antigen/teichoic acid export membrane protein